MRSLLQTCLLAAACILLARIDGHLRRLEIQSYAQCLGEVGANTCKVAAGIKP